MPLNVIVIQFQQLHGVPLSNTVTYLGMLSVLSLKATRKYVFANSVYKSIFFFLEQIPGSKITRLNGLENFLVIDEMVPQKGGTYLNAHFAIWE